MIINLDDFKKIEMKVGEIKSADKLENSEKLLKLSVDFGEENERQVISGIAGFFPDPNSLLGKRCAFVTNLEPKMIILIPEQITRDIIAIKIILLKYQQ